MEIKGENFGKILAVPISIFKEQIVEFFGLTIFCASISTSSCIFNRVTSPNNSTFPDEFVLQVFPDSTMYYFNLQAPATSMKEYLPPDVLAMLDPFWHRFPPQTQFFYTLMAMIYIVMGFTAASGNFLVLWIFSKFAKIRTPSNVLIMNLAFCDLMISVTMLPEAIYNFFMGGAWQFGNWACQLHAFCGSIFGIGQIATLIFISYDRYNVVVNGMSGKPLTYRRVALFLVFIWAFSMFWSVGPLVGYGSYALDGTLATCSYGFVDQSFTNVAYIVSVCVFAFLLPLLSIVFYYFYIVKAVVTHEKNMKEQAKKMNVASLKSNMDAKKQSTEIKIAKVALMNVALWVFAWTPFTVVSFMGVVGDQKGLTPLVACLPVMFAKSSCVYNPIIYSLTHPRFRKHLKKAIPWLCIVVDEGDNTSIASTASPVKQVGC